jgi:hypothetical protein
MRAAIESLLKDEPLRLSLVANGRRRALELHWGDNASKLSGTYARWVESGVLASQGRRST